MSSLLYVKASPRDGSFSTQAAAAFLDEYKKVHPKNSIDTLNVFTEPLPSFDGPALDAKYAIFRSGKPDEIQKKAWSAIEAVINRFKSAEAYLFSIPMWNFGIPYRLKQLFDVITQPGYTFSFSPAEGYKGLVTGRKAVTIYARGGEYSEGTPGFAVDFQKKYVETILGFIGITDVTSIVSEPTLAGGPDKAAAVTESAKATARKLVAKF